MLSYQLWHNPFSRNCFTCNLLGWEFKHLVDYMENEIELEQELREIYCNLKTGFQSTKQLYKKTLDKSRNG